MEEYYLERTFEDFIALQFPETHFIDYFSPNVCIDKRGTFYCIKEYFKLATEPIVSLGNSSFSEKFT